MTQQPERFPPDDPREWLRRAKSNLVRAKKREAEICLEDLCFDAQQVVEKSIKAIFVQEDFDFPYTHDISVLLENLKDHGYEISKIKDAVRLTDYAVAARYPGLQEPVSEEEYQEAVETAEKVLAWAKDIINTN